VTSLFFLSSGLQFFLFFHSNRWSEQDYSVTVIRPRFLEPCCGPPRRHPFRPGNSWQHPKRPDDALTASGAVVDGDSTPYASSPPAFRGGFPPLLLTDWQRACVNLLATVPTTFCRYLSSEPPRRTALLSFPPPNLQLYHI